jgi:hypothetical protein
VNLTGQLGECTEAYGKGLGFVRIYCDQTNGLVYTADYVSDPLCSPANIRQVSQFKMDRCAQSNIMHCDGEHFPPPSIITNYLQYYVVFKHCDTADCEGDSCATVYHVPDVCNVDLYVSRSSFVRTCRESRSTPPDVFAERLYSNASDLTCSTTDYVRLTHTTGVCLPRDDHVQEYFGGFVEYECAAAFRPGAAAHVAEPVVLSAIILFVALLCSQVVF